jgi:hypothetical protein
MALTRIAKGVAETRRIWLEGTEIKYRLRSGNFADTEQQLDQELQMRQQTAHEMLVAELSRELVEGEVSSGEVEPAIREALEKVDDFVSKGGHVEIAFHATKAANEVAALAEAQRKLELLEQEISELKRLHAPPDDPAEGE